MRAPPLARMAAVAAPRPDAEPVTIAHKPSLDIGISLIVLKWAFSRGGIAYRAVKSLQIRETPLCGIDPFASRPCRVLMPPSQAALRTALVRPMAFAHHKAQEKTHPKAGETTGRIVPMNQKG